MQQEYAMTLITRVFTSPYATPEGLGKLHTIVVALQRHAHSPRGREEIRHLLPDPKTKSPPPKSLLHNAATEMSANCSEELNRRILQVRSPIGLCVENQMILRHIVATVVV